MNYRKIWENHYGKIPIDENGVTFDIHHIDGNRENNDISNLKAVSIKEHYKIHLEQNEHLAAAAIINRILADKYKGWNHKEETKEKISKALMGHEVSIETRKKISENTKIAINSFEIRKHILDSVIRGDDHFMKTNEGKQRQSEIWKKNNPSKKESNRKKIKDRMLGTGNPMAKSISQYSLGGEFIKTFDTIRDAAKLLNLNRHSIGRVAKGIQNHCGGFLFKYDTKINQVVTKIVTH